MKGNSKMSLIDIFISRLRKIDKKAHFEIVDTICKEKLKEYISKITQNGEYVIILDENGFYKNDINVLGGLYGEVKRVGVGYIDIDFPTKSEDEDINMEDYKLIGIGAVNNFAKDSIKKQSLILGLSLGDFILDTSKSITTNKYLLVGDKRVLEHWGLKTYIKELLDRNFKCVLIDK
ncbi:MAG: hypothetical protein Q8942_09610 [Bacillota bacterium]|nr:hypothetical protein [Bacillota bacterium]